MIVRVLWVLFVLVFPAVAEMTLDDALKALGHDEEVVRREATVVLEKGGWESMSLFEGMKTDDPEVLLRVKGIREVIQLGLHREGSPELRAAILSLRILPAEKGVALLGEFKEELRKCPHILAGLHSRIATLEPQSDRWLPLRAYVEQELRWFFITSKGDFSIFDPAQLSVETCALLFNNLRDDALLEASPIYLKWLTVHPFIPDFLNSRGFLLEMHRLFEKGDVLAILGRLAALEDRSLIEKKRWELAERIKLEPFLEVVPSSAICRVLLMIHFEPKTPGECLPAYRKFLEIHPGLAAELEGRERYLELMRLRQEGFFYKAYAMLEGEGISPLYLRGEAEKLAEWASANRDKLEDGFPSFTKEGETLARIFLSEFVGIHPGDFFPGSEKEAREVCLVLNRSPQREDWRRLVKASGEQFLEVYLLLEEKALWPELLLPTKNRKIDLEPEVGRFLMARPELEKEIPVKELEREVLQEILGGLLSDLKLDQLRYALQLGKQWEEFHPGILNRKGSAQFDKFTIYRKWFSGDQAGAMEILSKSKIRDSEKGWLMEVFLNQEDVPNIDLLLDQCPLTTETLHCAFRRLVDPDDASDAAIRNAFSLVFWNRRSGELPEKIPVNLTKTSKHALRAWMSGEDERAFQYLEMTFWAMGRHPQLQQGRFSLWCHVLGRTDEALARLRANADSVCDAEYKMAYLLHAAGRFPEALQYREAIKETFLLQDLLISVGDWEALGRLELQQNEFRRRARVRWSSIFQGHASNFRPSLEKNRDGVRDSRAMPKMSLPPAPFDPPLPPLTVLENLIEPEVGKLIEPRSEQFRVLDTFVAVRKRWRAGQKQEARSLLVDCFSRIILDEVSERSHAHFRFFQSSPLVTRARSLSLGRDEIGLFAALELRLPLELAGDVARGLAHLPSRSRSRASSLAARYFQSVGDYEQALTELHFAFLLVEPESIAYRSSRLALCHYLRAMISAGQGEVEQTSKCVWELLKHAPYQSDDLISVVQALPEKDRKAVLELVHSFWAAKVERHPEVQGFQGAREAWLKRVAGFR